MNGASVRRRSYGRAGRLIPRRTRGLRAGSVILKPGGSMPWHSTNDREELLIVLSGSVRLELVGRAGRTRRIALPAGQSAWLARGTDHSVVNRGARPARYVYVTGAA
jgi:quercetin dioxygenase-like cupin family protein